jgi:hypothetical protein
LFKFKNETAKEGYILGKHFLNSFKDKIIFSQEEEETSIIKSPIQVVKENFEEMNNLESRLLNANENIGGVNNNRNPNVTERFHKEFKILNDEIFEIVKRNDISSGKIIIKLKSFIF